VRADENVYRYWILVCTSIGPVAGPPMVSFGGINSETRRNFFESLQHDGDMNTSADIELRGPDVKL
jgi:hypothetical protein